jgi:hypothetical protein
MKTKLSICGRIVRAVLLTFVATVLASTAFGYGNEGHQTVGAIADKLIANSPNTVAHLRALIGNETLEHASTWADDCKYHFNQRDHDMVTFVSANPHVPGTNAPHDHHAYHYTDIPIQETRYRADSVGAKPTDIVHMLRNCIAIIEGHSNATNNPSGITQKTALRLLVHYVGDIHQPLHVGTAYFGTNAELVNPNATTGAQADEGGNLIGFHGTNLHAYWDTTAVQNAMAAAHVQTPRAFARTIVKNPPPGWETSSFISGWAVKWANEVLPIATQAYNKLTFRVNPTGWSAQTRNLAAYDQWAAAQVQTEIARAGYRLAAILKKIWA